MKNNKAAGPSGDSDVIKAAGEAATAWIMDLCNSNVREGKIPEDWCTS